MSKLLYRLMVVLACFVSVGNFSPLQAQGSPAPKEILEGREFYFGIPHCDIQNGEGARGNPIQLWISSKVKTLVKVTVPRLGLTIGSYVLNPNKVQIIGIPQTMMNTVTGITENGIYIKADDPITTTVYVSYKWTGEAYRVIPAEVLGRRYFTLNLFQDKTERERPAQVLIVGTKDNTTVTFYPKALTEDGTPAGGAKTYRIHRGQTLLIKAKIQVGKDLDWSTDFTGSKITSSAPVAVFSGHTKGAFPRFQATMLGIPANFMRNMMFDAMWPVEFLGRSYFSAPVMYTDRQRSYFDLDSWGDLIRCVATEDNTIVYTKTAADASPQPHYPALKAGEEYRIDNQELPCLYTANKPILVGQYGKAWRLNQVSGTKKASDIQNPSRNGQGMMYVLTPEEQWSTFTTYHTPDEIDNFTMITFYTKDRGILKFDGAPINAKLGSYIKQVPGTDKSYVVAPVAAGDHTIEGAKFTAYVYGNWDHSKDGFAYGYPTGVNFAQTCPDSIAISGTMQCGTVTGLAKILPDTSTCGSIFSVEMVEAESKNYNFQLDPGFESGMLKAPFTLTPIDIRKDAHAKVIATSRSGKEATIEFNYVAEKISVKPTVVDFGSLPINLDSCTTIVVTNTSKEPTTVNEVFLRPGRAQFRVEPGKLPKVLAPNESMTLTVCALTKEALTATVKDSVIAKLSCYENPLTQLLLSGGVPCVQISDVTFAPSPVNVENGPLPCGITNTAKIDVTVNSITVPNDPTGKKFRHDLQVPIKVAAGENLKFNVWYTPTDQTSKDKINVVIDANGDDACSDKISEWSGSGLDAGPIVSPYDFKVVRVLDKYNTTVNGVTEYKGTVTVDAFGNDPLQNPRLSFTTIEVPAGADAATSMVFSTSQMPGQLFPNQPKAIDVSFMPKFTGDYKIKVTLTADFNGQPREAFSTVIGTAVVPIEDSLGYTWPNPVNIGTTAAAHDVVIYNSGSMDLTIKNLSVDAALDVNNAFQIDPAWMAANLGGGKTVVVPKMSGTTPSSVNVPVLFTARVAGLHGSRIIVDCDLDPSQINHPTIYGRGQQNIKVVVDSLDFGKVDKCSSKTDATTLVLTNQSNVDLTISDIAQVGDAAMFEIDPAQRTALIGTKVLAGTSSAPLTVTFHSPNPNATRRNIDRFDYSLGNGVIWKVTGSNGETNEQYSALAGTAVPTTVLVTTLPMSGATGYVIGSSQYDEPVTMEFNLRNNPDIIDNAGVTAFHAYIKYDAKVLSPVVDAASIGLSGTRCDGWKVRRVVTVGDTLDVELYNDTKTKPISGTGTLFTFKMKGYFSLLPQSGPSILGADMYATEYKSCINVDNLPSVVVFTPSCVADLRHANISINGYALSVPKPNPVSTSTTLSFSVAFDAPTSFVIYNSMGEAVLTPIDATMKGGTYDMLLDLTSLPSGSYFCRMISGSYSSPMVPLSVQK